MNWNDSIVAADYIILFKLRTCVLRDAKFMAGAAAGCEEVVGRLHYNDMIGRNFDVTSEWALSPLRCGFSQQPNSMANAAEWKHMQNTSDAPSPPAVNTRPQIVKHDEIRRRKTLARLLGVEKWISLPTFIGVEWMRSWHSLLSESENVYGVCSVRAWV